MSPAVRDSRAVLDVGRYEVFLWFGFRLISEKSCRACSKKSSCVNKRPTADASKRHQWPGAGSRVEMYKAQREGQETSMKGKGRNLLTKDRSSFRGTKLKETLSFRTGTAHTFEPMLFKY